MTIYAVNGKEPIAAWIPSLDTAGNGTTTLTDLVGSNDGTLTNMDAATDWVADTDAGGVRALDFDGSSEKVVASHSLGTGIEKVSFSCWFRKPASNTIAICSIGNETNTQRFHISWFSNSSVFFTVENGGISYASFVNSYTTDWVHFVLVYDGTQANNSTRLKCFANGVLKTVSYTGAIPSTAVSSNAVAIGAGGGVYATAKMDDIRIFDSALDATDIAYLYNSGNGRGIVATTPNTRRRRYAGGYGL